MLSSKRDRFKWGKEDRLAESSFFRQLHQNWHPTTRVVIVEDQLDASRRFSSSEGNNTLHRARRGAWNPWLWVGS